MPHVFKIIPKVIPDLIINTPNLNMSQKPVIVIHGGAWAIPDKLATPSVEGVKSAAVAGYKVLQEGGTAVDAVEAAVNVLENHPAFDAG